MNKQLTVSSAINNLHQTLMLMFSLISICSWMLYANFPLENANNYYLAVFVQLILVFFIIMFLFIFFYTFIQSKSEVPLAILNKDGIWIKYRGFISWENIEEISPYYLKNINLEMIGIRVKNNEEIFKHCSFIIKWEFIVAKFSERPPILLTKNNEILAFARQFTK